MATPYAIPKPWTVNTNLERPDPHGQEGVGDKWIDKQYFWLPGASPHFQGSFPDGCRLSSRFGLSQATDVRWVRADLRRRMRHGHTQAGHENKKVSVSDVLTCVFTPLSQDALVFGFSLCYRGGWRQSTDRQSGLITFRIDFPNRDVAKFRWLTLESWYQLIHLPYVCPPLSRCGWGQLNACIHKSRV